MAIINKDKKAIIAWLYLIAIMVFCMVLIGGITRLTDSGLSIVDWKPIMGIIPPIGHEEWIVAFNKYKAYPEYKLINTEMNLSGFKGIFFWEYFHRLFGRLIGLVFIVPYLFFKYRKSISKKLDPKLITLFILGGLQGLMGWYMVMSGLVSRPDVSHFRLAAHLSLAFLIIAGVFWTVLDLKNPNRSFSFNSKIKRPMILFFTFLSIQIVYGAFVAGLDAGLTHNTFPKMGRDWIPNEFFNNTGSFSQMVNAFLNNVVLVQFIHRFMAWSLIIIGGYLFFRVKMVTDFRQKRAIQLMLGFLVVQFILGVVTLLMYVPVSIASIHQIGACILILLCVRSLYFTFTNTQQQ